MLSKSAISTPHKPLHAFPRVSTIYTTLGVICGSHTTNVDSPHRLKPHFDSHKYNYVITTQFHRSTSKTQDTMFGSRLP